MWTKRIGVLVAMTLLLGLSACGYSRLDRSLSGGAIGAGVGAAGGAILGAPLAGAVLGAATGVATGYLTGEDQINLGEPIWK